jgi:hypothetical protein
MEERMKTQCIALFAVLVAAAPVARADDTYVKDVKEGEVKEAPKDAKAGWDLTLTVGATVNWNDNRDVVGQPTGSSFVVGGQLAGAAVYHGGKSEWRSALGLKESASRTPVIEQFVKSSDELHLETMYIYRFLPPKLGAFARASLDTALLAGEDVRAAPVTYSITDRDGTVTTVAGVTSQRLTDPFQPLHIKESLGVIGTPVAKEAITAELRVGFGARHIIADNQLVVSDNAGTPEIEIKEMETVNQGGAEIVATATGALQKKKVTYKASAEIMVPFLHAALPAGDDRGTFDLTNVELVGQLSFKLVSWASLDYQLRIVREPEVLDTWQVQNNLLLTFSYSLLDRKAK